MLCVFLFYIFRGEKRRTYFGEQWRDLLLYLYQKLDENNSSNQQVHIAVQ